jgi:hypothetical protein
VADGAGVGDGKGVDVGNGVGDGPGVGNDPVVMFEHAGLLASFVALRELPSDVVQV